ncbi:MAG TPA: hypothetical protein VF337_01265 [Candidatus Limnocylindrales bacterium]
MRAHSKPGGASRRLAAAAAVISISLAGCAAAKATPSRAPSLTPAPIQCDDGPDAFTPMPADCWIPTEPAPTPSPTPTARRTDPTISLPGLATLPPVTPWHGKTFYAPPSGTGTMLIGLGSDDIVYVLLERALPLPKPTPTSAFVVPDVAASVIALRPDGSLKAGWPSAGVPVSGYPYSYRVNAAGTVFVASGPNPFTSDQLALKQLTVTAIGSDGKVLAGWPYLTPAAQQSYDPDLLTTGPNDMVCFRQMKAGAKATASDYSMVAYCLGADGKLLPGWPYASPMSLSNIAVGPDGTVYMGKVTSTTASKVQPYTYPYQVIAIGPDGQPKPGWTAWSEPDVPALATILPTKDGRVYMLLGGDSGRAKLVSVDSKGKTISEHLELGSALTYASYKDAVLTGDGRLFVAIEGGSVNLVNAYSADGSQMAGWPQLIGGWGDLAVGADGSVWVSWTLYGASGDQADTSVVARFDKNGKLQPGYPMASDMLSTLGLYYGLAVASDGTAFGTSGGRIMVMGR